MKPTQSHSASAPQYDRNPRDRNPPSSATNEEAPFREGDVVEYLALPGRRFIVAHCYPRGVGNNRHWVVAEVNANTHLANDLRRVTPA